MDRDDEMGHNQSTSNNDGDRPSVQDDDDDKIRPGRDSSESSGSGSSSQKSAMNVAKARTDAPKAPILEAQRGKRKKKAKRVAGGRVEKRRRSVARRQVRKAPRRRQRGRPRRRDPSVSSIFTIMSCRSQSKSDGCPYCGHRCCRRRFEYELALEVAKHVNDSRRSLRRNQRKIAFEGSGTSVSVQAGSRAAMLSSLCLGSSPTDEDTQDLENTYSCITPEMIYETLGKLAMWRQGASITSIMEHMLRNYPVNSNRYELFEELEDKLKIAAIVGFVEKVQSRSASEDTWCLNCAPHNCKLTKNHIELFWEIYGDTMRPVVKRNLLEVKNKAQQERQTNTLLRI